jgi:hypothetical protein
MAEVIDVALTVGAQERALRYLASSSVESPTLCLMKGRTSGESEDRWMWGIYGPDNIESLTSDLARLGHSLLYEFSGLTVAIPQFHLLPELIGKTLGAGARGLTVVSRDGA